MGRSQLLFQQHGLPLRNEHYGSTALFPGMGVRVQHLPAARLAPHPSILPSLQDRLKIVKGGIISNPLTLSQPSSYMLGSSLQDRLKVVKGGSIYTAYSLFSFSLSSSFDSCRTG